MLLEIDNFEQFKVFFDVIYDITDLIELQLFNTHMVCSILDKAKVRFMTATFKSDFFAVYEVDDAESVTLFVEDLHKIIKSANKIDNVILCTNDDYLVCKFESKNGNTRVFEFVLPAEYIDSPKSPSISLPVSFDLKLSDLKQGINDLKVVGSDEIQFSISDGFLNITAGVETTTNYAYSIPMNVEGSMSSKFSMDYISQLLKFDKINSTGKFNMGDDYPLLYSFEDEIMGVKITGVIAPRIEVD